ncbi:uncharacterized protein SPPG_01793 [Spizellomyces punctatus DAOM BR117]|uniref:PSP1 C-terminal domain-containing protein n=1 Tax=Spizellomyces punctatus (strain DAOM BR117) TaxID=645134 RepID=A0A0L0HP27_SPIPD|nr:uncharacterized protein SPPG_01793 [Spizellomyces punctatus DAOM BR117]KND02710.1 hypothetical protein SPPG_01793 [Spizellomyces punctatus DAOM BR117]|eukprot:XP_016610749.1 hypothetical protein SPPG_01793 [Spizellomyces punctatus DAOM BR117]
MASGGPPHDIMHRRNVSTGSSVLKPTIAQVAAAAAARSAGKKPESPQQQTQRSGQTAWGRSVEDTAPPSSSEILRARKHSLPATSAALAIAAANMSPEDTWKIVGSPPRRFSLSVPPTPDRFPPEHNGVSVQHLEREETDELILSRQRAIRTRAASTPNPLMAAEPSTPDYPPGLGPKDNDTSANTPNSAAWSGPSVSWAGSSSSIWQDGAATTGQPSVSVPAEKASGYLPPDIAVTTAPFPSRQFRSFSFSLGSMRGLDGYEEEEKFDRDRVTTMPLRGGDDNEDDDYDANLTLPKVRSRSKSSSEIYGLLAGQEPNYSYPVDNATSPVSPTVDYGDLNSIWAATQGTSARDAGLLKRRGSTQSGIHWESLRPGQADPDEIPSAPSPDRLERYRQQRRFSHAPGLYNDYAQQMMTRPTGGEPDVSAYDLARRRHSLAGPLYSTSASKFLSEGLEGLSLDDHSDTPFLDEIDDYFENTKRRTRAWVEAGKNLQMQSYTHQWPLFVVEFKAGRTDFFFVAEPSALPVKKGDLVIVEADRGKDLGKVIEDSIQNIQQLQIYQAQHAESIIDAHSMNKEVHPKRIFRTAQPAEVTMLVSKSQDEAKAMAVCQTKIRQKKLPMEIVDAEYQWDRRKLTFYFVADRRIDFRELVRELFKIYKTRIWMCAVNPMKPILKKQ